MTRPSTWTEVNEVRLVGRVSQDPEERVLPSGDSLWTFRIVVGARRPRGPGGRGSTHWTARCGEAAPDARVRSWRTGDMVEVGERCGAGSSDRAGTASRVEVEVAEARLIRRASSA